MQFFLFQEFILLVKNGFLIPNIFTEKIYFIKKIFIFSLFVKRIYNPLNAKLHLHKRHIYEE